MYVVKQITTELIMATIFLMTCVSHDFLNTSGQHKYFSGAGKARREAEKCLMQVKRSRLKTSLSDFSPVMCVRKCTAKTGLKSLLEALTTGDVTLQSSEAVECLALDNNGKLYSWKGNIDSEPESNLIG
jgi:hypothetical protein